MEKQIILQKIEYNNKAFIDYLSNLSNEEFDFRNNQKWSAGQQLEHIVLSIRPLVQFFGLGKTMIEQKYGSVSRQNRTYEDLRALYIEKLAAGGKAPEKYVPETNSVNERENLTEMLETLTKELISKIETFTDQELSSLQIPHPLLGMLTLREMLYNAIYHIEHHFVQAKNQLR